MVFHWSLSDSKSPQVSRTRLRILAVLSNTVIWIVSTRPPTSKSSRPFNNPLVIVPKEPITISTIVTFMFRSFFNSLARSRYLSFFSHSFRFSCLHFWNEACWFLSLRVFGLFSSSLLLFPQRFGRYVLCQVFVELGNLHGTSNYVLYWIHGGSPVLIPLAITR